MPNAAMIKSRDAMLSEAVQQTVASLNKNPVSSRKDRTEQLYNTTCALIDAENQILPKENQQRMPKSVTTSQLAELIQKMEPIYNVRCTDMQDSNGKILAIYMDSGPDMGLYTTDETIIRNMIRQYNNQLTPREIKDIFAHLQDVCDVRDRCTNPDLIAVNNGIFDFRTKILHKFSKDVIFLSKSHVNYNQMAYNVNLYNPNDNTNWDIESWMFDIANNDPEVTQLLWEILSAVVRPFVRWNKMAMFYSNKGNNGKGTLCSLMRNLIGETSCASIPLSDFCKDFLLEPLLHSSAIIVDENDVGDYIDKSGNLKAVITGDPVQINRKFKQPVSYSFHGMVVQCINDLPRVRDKSDSIHRRMLFVPFLKCFTGIERKYIKEEYLRRIDVLEYVLLKVLHMNHYQLSTPACCNMCLNEYKENNDSLRVFLDEILPECKWDMLPFQFLYDLYSAWCEKNMPSAKSRGRTAFIRDLISVIDDYPDWQYPGKYNDGRHIKLSTKCNYSISEPLIAKYNLTSWYNPHYMVGIDIDKKCQTGNLKPRETGILRSTCNVANYT